MEKLLALKVDVDTWIGTRRGVPRLVDLFSRVGADATFLFSLGPDHTGRAIARVLRPGFLGKVARTSVVEHYGLRTLLHGTLLPGPDIGRREAALMRSVRDRGFEVGIHTWDHILWQDRVVDRDAAWTRRQMERAAGRFVDIFGVPARTHGAAGWKMNEAAFRFEREMGLTYASDLRGTHPHQPVDAGGEPLGPPQLPTTLPTLDELIGLEGRGVDEACRHLLRVTESAPARCHVHTLHAELEGGRFLEPFERLLSEWKAMGYRLTSCAGLFAALDPATLPRHRVRLGTVPGRAGTVVVQAEEVKTSFPQTES